VFHRAIEALLEGEQNMGKGVRNWEQVADLLHEGSAVAYVDTARQND
jgi:hypothetical protein